MTFASVFSTVSAAALTLLAVSFTTPSAHAADPQCAAAIQNRIPWDYNGNTTWALSNIERLCAGAVAPKEPPKCFNRAMHGNLATGGMQWTWPEAIRLCGGTNYADNTIACFETRVAQGAAPADAIAACRSSQIRSAPSNRSVMAAMINRTSAPVDVYWYDFNGALKSYATIQPGMRHMQQTFAGHAWQFVQQGKEVGRFVANNEPRQPVMIGMRDAGDGPIWSTADAQQKCPNICDRQGRTWTGDWTTVVQGQSSVCRCIVVSSNAGI